MNEQPTKRIPTWLTIDLAVILISLVIIAVGIGIGIAPKHRAAAGGCDMPSVTQRESLVRFDGWPVDRRGVPTPIGELSY